MQFGSFVAGVEADINYIDRNNGSTGSFPSVASPAVGTDFRVSRGNGDNWFGTVRGRLGFAFDRALIYLTGGLAYGEQKLTVPAVGSGSDGGGASVSGLM